MSKLKKSIIKRYANKKLSLKKYPNGTSSLDYSSWGSNIDTSQISAPQVPTTQTDPYQRTPRVTSGTDALAGSKGIVNNNKQLASNYAGYAGAAMNAYGAYAQASNNPNLSSGQKTAAGTNAAVDATLSTVTPWYGLAKTASGLGKSFLDYDENGVPKTSTQRQANNLMTAPHESAINHAGNNNWGAAFGSISSGGLSDNIAETFNLDPNAPWKKAKDPNAGQETGPVYDRRTYDEQMLAGSHGIVNNYSAKHGMVVPTYGDGGRPHERTLSKTDSVRFEGIKESWKGKDLTKLMDYALVNYEKDPLYFKAYMDLIPTKQMLKDSEFDRRMRGPVHNMGTGFKQNPDGSYTQFNNGGQTQPGYPVVEYQGGEVVFVPKGKGFVKYADPKATKTNQHEQGGIKSPLPEGAVIFSKRFAKKANEAYEANDTLRIKALMQQQDNYNLRQGNPINGSIGTTMQHGGRIRKYDPGTSSLRDLNYDPAMFAQNYMGGQAYTGQQGTQGNLNDGSVTRQYSRGPNSVQQQWDLQPDDYNSGPNWEDVVAQQQSPQSRKTNIPYGTIAEQSLMFAGQNIGNFRDLKKGRNWDRVNYGQVTPERLDPTEAIRSAKDQAAAARYQLREAVGGNAGAYLANLRNVNTGRSKQIADTIYQYKNANAEIGNKAKYYNNETGIRAQIDEAANKGAAHNITRAATAQIGENAAQQYRDYKGGQLNKYEADLFYQMYPNFPKNAAIPPELVNYYKGKK